MKESFGKDQSFISMQPTWPGDNMKTKLVRLSQPEMALKESLSRDILSSNESILVGR